jgi:hypothetical protein
MELSHESIMPILTPIESPTGEIIHTTILSIELGFFIRESRLSKYQHTSYRVHDESLHRDTIKSFWDLFTSAIVSVTEMREMWREELGHDIQLIIYSKTTVQIHSFFFCSLPSLVVLHIETPEVVPQRRRGGDT